jgi:hypothetical protein
MSGILVQTVGQCKMQIWRYPENFNQTTDVFRFHLSKLGSAFAQLLSRSSIMRVGTSSTYFQNSRNSYWLKEMVIDVLVT